MIPRKMTHTVELLMIVIDGNSVIIFDIPNEDVTILIQTYQSIINNLLLVIKSI
jgi:hypothetical protein